MSCDDYAVPGQLLGSEPEFTPGDGTYSRDKKIYSLLLGKIVKENIDNNKVRLNITTTKNQAKDYVINVNDIVLARVIRSNYNQCYVDVISVNNNTLYNPIKALIRKEDISSTNIDSIVISKVFRLGDIVQAEVLSLGDNKYYFLSTKAESMGVVQASEIRLKM